MNACARGTNESNGKSDDVCIHPYINNICYKDMNISYSVRYGICS